MIIIDAVLLYLATDEGDTDNLLNYWLLLFPIPAYPLARSMMYLSSDYPLYKVAAAFEVFTTPDPYKELGPFFGAMVVQGFLYFGILFIIEFWPYIGGLL